MSPNPDIDSDIKPPHQPPHQPAPKIAVIGCGLWGRHIIRNCASLDSLAYVCDQDRARAMECATQFHCEAADFSTICADASIQGIIIATPPSAHKDLALTVLAAGKHVFIEKPMAMNLAEAEAIRDAARIANRQVMVGHLIRYHPAFQELQKQIEHGAIGKIRHIQASRLAMGRIRATESALHDLCPHDISLILALTGEGPIQVTCHGASYITPYLADMLSTGLGFANGMSAQMQTSWLSPIKEHRLVVTGETGALVFDDVRAWSEKLTLYSDHITRSGPLFVIERASPLHLPVPESEPLKQEIGIFLDLCSTDAPPPTDADEAIEVMRVLDAMQAQFISLNKGA